MSISTNLASGESTASSTIEIPSNNSAPSKVKNVFFRSLITNEPLYFDSDEAFEEYLLRKLKELKNNEKSYKPIDESELSIQVKDLLQTKEKK